jgi:hypothetical protein
MNITYNLFRGINFLILLLSIWYVAILAKNGGLSDIWIESAFLIALPFFVLFFSFPRMRSATWTKEKQMQARNLKSKDLLNYFPNCSTIFFLFSSKSFLSPGVSLRGST